MEFEWIKNDKICKRTRVMSLDKAIEHGKEKRKPYTGDKAVDNECRNHGSCSWCREKRLHSIKIQEDAADAKIKEYEQEGWE